MYLMVRTDYFDELQAEIYNTRKEHTCGWCQYGCYYV